MGNPVEAGGAPEALPPIILLIVDGAAVSEYASAFEAEGLWVSSVTVPTDVLPAAFDLRPDAVIVDLPHGPGRFLPALHALKSTPRTQQIPVIAISPDPPVEDAQPAVDLWMPVPTSHTLLVRHVRDLVRHSQRRRDTADSARRRAEALIQHSNRVAGGGEPPPPSTASTRCCPTCDRPLSLVERGRIGSVEYEYYRWCDRGCGLYCYDCVNGKWMKLA